MSEQKIDLILDELKDIKISVGELKTDVGELKTDVSELKIDVSGLKTDVTEIKIEQKYMGGQLESVLSELEYLKMYLHQNLGNTAINRTEIVSLQNRVQLLEEVVLTSKK